MVHVETFKGGFDSNFSYLVWDKETKEAAVFDASVKPERIFARVKELGLHLKFVFIMHSHFDHLIGLDEYRKAAIPLFAHDSIAAEVDAKFKHNDIVNLGTTSFSVLHAPGHRFDCVLLYGDGKVFTTDVLFVGACGRCDLEGSDPDIMYHTLYEIFAKLPDNTVIYPGHDYGDTPTSTVKREKEENPYLLCGSKEEFLRNRMGL